MFLVLCYMDIKIHIVKVSVVSKVMSLTDITDQEMVVY